MAYKPTTTGTPIERLVGCMALTTLSACYYYSALWLPVALCWYFWGSKVVGVFLLVLYFLSVALPPVRCPRLLSTWFYKCALKLHDFEEARKDFGVIWLVDMTVTLMGKDFGVIWLVDMTVAYIRKLGFFWMDIVWINYAQHVLFSILFFIHSTYYVHVTGETYTVTQPNKNHQL